MKQNEIESLCCHQKRERYERGTITQWITLRRGTFVMQKLHDRY